MKNNLLRLLSALLAVLVGIDTAAACRWLRSCHACTPTCEVVCEPVVCEPVCSSWTVVEEPACGGCDSCGEGMASESVTVETHSPAGSSGVPTPAAPPEPTPVHEPAPTPAAFGGSGFRSDASPAGQAPAPSPQDWDAGLEQTPPSPTVVAEEPANESLPAPIEEPADDLFASPATAEEPVMEEKPRMEDKPADDLFGAPAEEDDLFGAPAKEPAEDDLFGEEPAATEPATDGGDDLFGEEPADDEGGLFGEEPEESDDLFGESAPAEPTEAEAPEDDLFGEEPAAAEDDLFGEEPAEEPATEEDDLFGESAEESAEEGLFGEEPAEDDGGLFGEEPAADDGDDLFGEEPADEETPEDDEDDLFGGFGATLREAGGLYSARERTWVDNTGRYSTVGRLIALDGASVRLMMHNGKVASVPLARLSQSDLEFVSRQSLAQSQIREWAIANGKSPTDGFRTAQR